VAPPPEQAARDAAEAEMTAGVEVVAVVRQMVSAGAGVAVRELEMGAAAAAVRVVVRKEEAMAGRSL
jgi:hypothetical protein